MAVRDGEGLFVSLTVAINLHWTRRTAEWAALNAEVPMIRLYVLVRFASGWLLTLPLQAARHVVEPGQTLTLDEDLVLAGNDSLEVRGTPEKRCTLVGNNHRIRSG